MSRVTIIEFTGPPGSGKTTLTRLVQDSLQSSGFKCFDVCGKSLEQLALPASSSRAFRYISRLKYMVGAGCFYVSHPALLCELYRFTRKLDPDDPWVPRLSVILLKQAYMLMCLKKLAESRGYEIVLLDQAIIQTMWSFLWSCKEVPERELACLLYSLRNCLSSAVIQCRLDSRTAYQRIAEREPRRSRIGEMDEKAALSLLGNKSHYFPALTRLVRNLNGCPVLEIDTGEERCFLRDQIVQFITQLHPFNKQSAGESMECLES